MNTKLDKEATKKFDERVARMKQWEQVEAEANEHWVNKMRALGVPEEILRSAIKRSTNRSYMLHSIAAEHQNRAQEVIDLYRKAQEDNVIMPFHLVLHAGDETKIEFS